MAVSMMLRCEDCGFRFDPDDSRAKVYRGTFSINRCALCEALSKVQTWGAMWVMKNNCQGLFDDELYMTKGDCEAKWDLRCPGWREWRDAKNEPDGRAVPVVVVEIPRDRPAFEWAVTEDWRRERKRKEYKETGGPRVSSETQLKSQ